MSSPQVQTPAKPDGVVMDILTGASIGGQANSADEAEIVRMVMGLLSKAKVWQNIWAKNYERWWNLWETNHYQGKRPHSLTQAVVNQIWSACETFTAHITEGLSEPIVRSRMLKFKDKAKTLSKWLIYEADINNLGQEMEHPVRSACVTGIGWLCVEWDEKKFGGRGDVSILSRDQKFVFVSPQAKNMAEARYLVDASNVPREFVVNTWEKGSAVPPGIIDVSLENLRSYENKTSDAASPNWLQATTTTGSDSWWTSAGGGLGLKKSDLVTLIKCYIRQTDGSMRLVVVCNGVLLQDGPSPYDDDEFPYVPVNILPSLDTINGRGIVQFIENLQEILNETISYLLDQQRFSSDPMLGASSANLEDGQLIDNSPGAVLPDSSLAAGNGQGYYWLNAPGFNQAWLQIQELVTGFMDSVLGRTDILQGEQPTGVNTLGGLEILRDEANIRMRKHIKWVKASLKRVYLLVISRLRQFAKDERVIRLTGKSGQDEFVTINPVQGVGPDGSLDQDFTIPSEAEFDVEFGKDIPGGRQAKMEAALALASTPAEDGMPMVDRQWVLDQLDIQEAPEIMDRLNQLAQQQAQAQATAGQPQQPPESDPMDKLTALLSGVA